MAMLDTALLTKAFRFPPHPGWIVDELMEALRYDHTTTGPGPELELSEERKAP